MTNAHAPVDFDAVLLLIGKLNYTWTNTESLLIHLIAGLAGTDKETGVIIFLTLNTTRARVDLVERLAKSDRAAAEARRRILPVTQQILKLGGLRNRYNHSIYSFDPESGHPRTIQMRIADRKDDIKVGQVREIDADAIEDIEAALATLKELNAEIWRIVRRFGYPS